VSGDELNGRTPADVLALAERVLRFADAESPTEVEVMAMADDASLTRFANSEIHQNVAESNVQVNLRFVVGKRVGVASTNRSDDDGLRRLAERAAAIARNCEELEDWGGLPAPTAIHDIPEGFAATTADATPELRADGVRAVIAAADTAGVKSYGSFSTATETLGIANTRGVRAAQRRTVSQLLTVAMAPDGGSGYAESAAVDITAIDAAEIGRQAAEKARATGNPIAVDPGEWPVVLEEYAVVDLLSMLGFMGFSALAVQEERSFSEPGRRVGSDLVSIVDDGHDPATLPMAFDYEGVAKERVSLIDRGVCRDVVFDAQTAARAGRASTGHGLPAPNPYGPFPLNMAMAAGDTPREELVRGLDRGLLVTRFHYTNPVHPKLAIVTGMTRDGTFYVESGEIKGPVRNLRFTQSYLEALAATSAISRERRTLKGDFGGVLVPAIRVDSWNFTGATEH
jgi:PmbA protein